jgi:hypothetical protein
MAVGVPWAVGIGAPLAGVINLRWAWKPFEAIEFATLELVESFKK